MAYTLDDFCTDSRPSCRRSRRRARCRRSPSGSGSCWPSRPSSPNDLQRRHAGRQARPAITIRDTDFYRAGARAGGQQGRQAAQPRRRRGRSTATAREIHGDDGVASRQSRERRPCRLAPVSRYRLGPGQTKAYGPGVIHSTAHPQKAWVIRVTGTDLDVLPRYHFGKQDRMLEQRVSALAIWAGSRLPPLRRRESCGHSHASQLQPRHSPRRYRARGRHGRASRFATAASAGALQQKTFARL